MCMSNPIKPYVIIFPPETLVGFSMRQAPIESKILDLVVALRVVSPLDGLKEDLHRRTNTTKRNLCRKRVKNSMSR